jgi:hypothetical protein
MHYAGSNIGYGNLKLRTPAGSHKIASVVARPNDKFQPVGLFAKRQTTKVTMEGTVYEIGEDAALIDVNPQGHKIAIPRWSESIPYRVLRQYTIDRLADEQGNDPDWSIVMGVAVNQFTDEKYVKNLEAQWQNEHLSSTGVRVNIRNVHVVPEPVGAYWATVLTNPSLKSVAENGSVLTIDGGYFTLDWAVVTRLALQSETCGAVNRAMHRVFTTIQQALNKNHQSFDLVAIEAACVNKKPLFTGHSEEIDLVPYLKTALDQHVPLALTTLITSCAEVIDNDPAVIVAGGSAPLLLPYIKHSLHGLRIFVPEDPQMANAEGYYLMAQTLCSEEG